jgi:hypothetical protein
LFKKQQTSLPGLQELKQKLSDMGFENIVSFKNIPKKNTNIESTSGGSKLESNQFWYYLGP